MKHLHDLQHLLQSHRKLLVALLVLINLLMIAAMVSLLSGCAEKDLCYHHDHVVKLRVAFDWRDAPDARVLGMSVFFYPENPEYGERYRFNLSNTNGDYIEVAPGKYRVITYNIDTEFTSGFNTDAFHDHYLYTREGSLIEPMSVTRSGRNEDYPRPAGSESEPVVVSPDELWGCTAIDVEVTEQGLTYRCFPLEEKDDWIGLPPIVTEHVITLYPHDLICRYSFEVRNVQGLENVENMSGILTGMAPSLLVHDETLGTQCVTIPVEAHKNLESNSIEGSFFTFGHHEQNEAPHLFALYLSLKDGKMQSVCDRPDFDVTDQIHAAPDRKRVHFFLDGLEIEGEGDLGGNPWQPSIDDYEDIYEDVKLQ